MVYHQILGGKPSDMYRRIFYVSGEKLEYEKMFTNWQNMDFSQQAWVEKTVPEANIS